MACDGSGDYPRMEWQVSANDDDKPPFIWVAQCPVCENLVKVNDLGVIVYHD